MEWKMSNVKTHYLLLCGDFKLTDRHKELAQRYALLELELRELKRQLSKPYSCIKQTAGNTFRPL